MKKLLDLDKFKACHLMVIGDIMLDNYLFGHVKRISPEAPVPVFHIQERSEVPGGAGNVVSNLVGLGCKVTIIGVRGDDEKGRRLNGLFSHERIQNLIFTDPGIPTVTKTRLLAKGQQLLRLDEEEVKPLSQDMYARVIGAVNDRIEELGAIILSDYGKGVLQTNGLCQEIIRLANRNNIPVIVDPKGKDWERYTSATCITPNALELETAYGEKISGIESLAEGMRQIQSVYKLPWLLVTRGSLGMCLMHMGVEPEFIPAVAREVYDVSGAGDTVIATLALGVASGLNFGEAARLANLAAGIVVGKLGTQPVNISELKSAVGIDESGLTGLSSAKVAAPAAASLQVLAWKTNGEKVIFTNGCFDLLHPGHIHLLHQAKALGDRLIVGMNSDDSVRRLKGATRPILSEQDRASMLASLDCVDLVVVFTQDTPKELIAALKPDVLAKGADYSLEEVVGRDIVEAYGGRVQLINLLKGYSTTDITKRILQAQRGIN